MSRPVPRRLASSPPCSSATALGPLARRIRVLIEPPSSLNQSVAFTGSTLELHLKTTASVAQFKPALIMARLLILWPEMMAECTGLVSLVI